MIRIETIVALLPSLETPIEYGDPYFEGVRNVKGALENMEKWFGYDVGVDREGRISFCRCGGR